MVVHVPWRISTNNRPMTNAGIDAVEPHKSSRMILVFVDGPDFQAGLCHDALRRKRAAAGWPPVSVLTPNELVLRRVARLVLALPGGVFYLQVVNYLHSASIGFNDLFGSLLLLLAGNCSSQLTLLAADVNS